MREVSGDMTARRGPADEAGLSPVMAAAVGAELYA